MAICTYCGREARATREHIIPAFVLRLLESMAREKAVGWNEIAQKSIASDAVVRDVCETCNSGVLSLLDNYAASMLGRAGLMVAYYCGRSLDLLYDHDLLLRWVLKVSYNAARTTSAAAALHLDFLRFVLGRAPAPMRGQLFMLAQLVAPLDEKDKAAARDGSAASSALGSDLNAVPFLFRIGPAFIRGLPAAACAVRALHIGAAVFYLVLPEHGTTPGGARTLARRICAMTGATELASSRKFAQLHAGTDSWFDHWAPQLAREVQVQARRGKSSAQ